MLPIIATMMLPSQTASRWRAFELSIWYVLSLALTYAVSGIAAAALGASLQTWLQTPWILIISGLFLILLAILLIFPAHLTWRGQAVIQHLQSVLPSHTRWGAAGLGILSALVISPCITPPLIGALIYIANQDDVVLGGSALFMLGLGSGLPLIAITLLGSRLLPKSGRWMTMIQYIFALALCVIALSLWGRLGHNIFTPVTQLISGITPTLTTPAATITQAQFHRVSTPAALQQHLEIARQQRQMVVLEFYADWCSSCLLLDRHVFSNPAVMQQLTQDQVYGIKIDVTLNDEAARALQGEWQVFGPPTTIFLNAHGEEMPHLRLVGEFSQQTFLEYLKRTQ